MTDYVEPLMVTDTAKYAAYTPSSVTSRLDLALDPDMEEEKNEEIRLEMENYKHSFGSLNLMESYSSLFELLWNSRLPCVDIHGVTSESKDELSFIKRCYWKNEPVSCNAIFEKRATDQGLCCSFNAEKAETLFKASRYASIITEMQKKEHLMGMETRKKPQWYTSNSEPMPNVGRDFGLTVVVDGHSDKLSPSTVSDNFRGFVTHVDERSKFPSPSLSGVIAKPGHVTNIEVNAFSVESVDEIKDVKPKERNCYFPDEYPLEMHQFYSHSSCVLECEIKFASKCLETCKDLGQECDCNNHRFLESVMRNETGSCIPWFYPAQDDMIGKVCNPWETKKFIKIIRRHIPQDECQHCLPDCSTTVYDHTVSNARFRKCDHTNIGTSMLCDLIDGDLNPAPWTTLVENEYKNENQDMPLYASNIHGSDGNISRSSNVRPMIEDITNTDNLLFPTEYQKNSNYDAFENDIGIINIFFSKKHVTSYVKQNRTSLFELLAKIGGSLGFAMGLSIVSIVEIIYWFTIRLFKNLKKEI